MGRYLNTGNRLFKECLNTEIYVDKTELIRYTNMFLNGENKLLCVSRPRRFGKSMALKMLAAYYSRGCDSRELFAELKVCDFEEKPESQKNCKFEKGWDSKKKQEIFEMGLNRYDTLLLDMQGIIGTVLMDVRTQQEILDFQRKLPQMSQAERNLATHPLLTAVQRRIHPGSPEK